MNLFNSLYRLVGRAEGDYALKTDVSFGDHCPDEADILTYLEGKTSSRGRAELQGHFARCSDCCELLALLIKIPDEPVEAFDETTITLSDDAVKKQAARVLAFIENDEARYDKTSSRRSRSKVIKKREGVYISYPALASLAVILCAITVCSVVYFSRDHRPQAGMDALRLAMKEERRTPARISGGLPHSPYALIRGEEDSDGLQFERAMNKLKYAAEDASADPEARLALARVHLALGKREEAKKALTILEQLVAGGNHSAEVLNDLGVAQFQLENYDEAISNFNKAIEKSPTFSEPLFNRALAKEHGGRIEEAKQDWEQFIAMTSDVKWKAEAERYLSRL